MFGLNKFSEQSFEITVAWGLLIIRVTFNGQLMKNVLLCFSLTRRWKTSSEKNLIA